MDVLKSEPFWTVKPKPAFVAKLRQKTDNVAEEKIFLNFCTCEELPPPAQDIDEDRLAVILESSDPGSYRIPISVGELHEEEDKSGKSCKVYDIILNDRFYSKRVEGSELFRAFLILVAIDAVETKHDLRNIDRQNWIVLKNRKSIGDVQPQRIRKQPKPLIELLDVGDGQDSSKSSITNGHSSSEKLKVKYEIRKDHQTKSTKITATFWLEGIKSASDIELDVGEHRIRVQASKLGYSEDVFLPMSLNTKNAKSRFLTDEGKLVVDVPIAL